MPLLSMLRQPIQAVPYLLALFLGACGGGTGSYPKDWQPLVSKQSAHGCSDLQGTFVFDETHRDYDAMTFSLLSTFLGAGVSQVFNAPIRSFTIAGDADTMLTVSFLRDSAVPTENAANAPPTQTQTITVERGKAYTCDDGWVVGTIKQDLRVNYPKHSHYDYKDVDYRQGSLGPQIVRLRRDAEGGLVGRTTVREARVLSLWAETGVGIPYWLDFNTYWTHWQPTQRTAAPSASDAMTPQKRARIERQENEQESGANAMQR